MKSAIKRLLIFHPTIAPYRVDFFNDLSEAFEFRLFICDINSDTFNYKQIYSQLKFQPIAFDGFWRQIDSFDPDVVMVSEFSIGTMKVLLHRLIKRKSYKIISICDDSYNMLAENNDFSLMHKWARRIIVPFLDDLFVVEPQARKWYHDKYRKGFFFPIIRDANKQRMIYKSVLSDSLGIIQDKHLIDKNVFLYVGRFVVIKNIGTIIKAFSSLDQRDNILVLVGSGEEEDNLKTLASDLNVNVVFAGRLEGDALYAWYNVADYFVLASYQEPFGAVTNEALLAGCHCLISSKAGSNCLIEEGKNGFMFSPMDVGELTEKMKRIIEVFPTKRPLEQVKPNLMRIDYQVTMKNLIEHIKSM